MKNNQRSWRRQNVPPGRLYWEEAIMSVSLQRFKGKYRIASSRLKEWDYGTPGYYFVTICTKNRVSWFGEVITEQMLLSTTGSIVRQFLEKIPDIYPNISIDAWVVMPNHIHAIIAIGDVHGGQVEAPQVDVETPHWGVSTKKRNWRPGILGVIINQYVQNTFTRWDM
jgi:putative transposase